MIVNVEERWLTMPKQHSKKRNAQLLWEFLIRKVTSSLVSGDKRTANAALKIIRRHFKPGTELYREFRLINSLVKTTVSTPAVAASIMNEAKRAAKAHDPAQLDRQKSLLIRDINHVINDPAFYDQHVSEYRTIATIQTLLNDWRAAEPDLSRMAMYEERVHSWLVSEKPSAPTGAVVEESPGTAKALVRVMMQKLNEKYSRELTDDQRALVRAYAFSTASDDGSSLSQFLVETKERVVRQLDSYASEDGTPDAVREKAESVKAEILKEDVGSVDDDRVSRFLMYMKLASEITTPDGDKNV